MLDTTQPLDIGHGHVVTFTRWAPDRELNPQYADLPDVDPIGLMDDHNRPDGTPCVGGAVMFECEAARRAFPNRTTWTLVSLEPLTITPSLLCRTCGDHGFITSGRWCPC